MDQDWLSDMWMDANGGTGDVIWISEIYGNSYGDAAREASKYPTKPLEMKKWSDTMLGEAAEALEGRKRVFTIHKLPALEVIRSDPVGCLDCGGPMREVSQMTRFLEWYDPEGVT